MTREEAIEILQGAIKKPNTKDGYLGQAIDMAIKALEQETVSKESYDHEYFLRKEFEIKIARLEQHLSLIRAEIESYKLSEDELSDMDEDSVKWGMKIASDILDKHHGKGG